MSPIGRIFIVLNLVMSAAFLGWAANAVATSQNWRAQYDDLKTNLEGQVEERDTQIAGLSQSVSTQENETANQRSRADLAEANAASLQERLNTAIAENEQLNASIDGINSTLGDYENLIDGLRRDMDTAVSAQHAAEGARDTALEAQMGAEEAQREAEERLDRANETIADHERTMETQRQDISQLETEKAKLQAYTGVSVSEIEVQPFIHGQVLAFRDELGGIVTLNVGAEDGVKRGFTFEIYEGPNYKGRVRVQDVVDNMCSALVDFPVDGQMIGVGDQAKTNL